jgi:protein TonB
MKLLGAALLVSMAGWVLGSSVGGAQSTRGCTPATSDPYLVCQVDRAPRPDSLNPGPRYPAILQQAGMSGTVRAAFVVNVAGRVEPTSVLVADSAHVLFATAVKEALRAWRFEPGVKDGRPVAIRWEQIFSFSLPRDSDVPLIDAVVLARDTAPDGLPRIVVGVPTRAPEAILLFNNRELLAAQRNAFAVIAPAPLTDSAGRPRVTMCLTINRGTQEFAADTATLRALAAPGRRATIPRDCPPTYAMKMYDTQPAPPGYIDPYIMSVSSISAWNADILLTEVEVSQAAATTSYRCWATRGTPAWRTTCRPNRRPIG